MKRLISVAMVALCAVAQAATITVKNFDADLATVYVNDQPTTNGQQVAVDGTVKIELGGFRNDYYFRYAPETQTDRELAFDCWEGVPAGCWGVYQTADGKKRFYLVQRDSKYGVRTGLSVVLK